jgi:hypothetical protein
MLGPAVEITLLSCAGDGYQWQWAVNDRDGFGGSKFGTERNLRDAMDKAHVAVVQITCDAWDRSTRAFQSRSEFYAEIKGKF